MGSFDSVTWQALTVVLTVAGAVSTFFLWRRRGTVSGLRALGLTLLVPAAYLTGTLRLLWEVGDAVVGWATRLVFSPVVWLGVTLAGVAVLLLLTAGVLGRRGKGGKPRAVRRRGRPGALAATGETGDVGARVGTGGPDDIDDMDDIEAILRRHGIS